MDQLVKKPRTFICYRGSTSGNNAGMHIAEYLRDILSEQKDFAPVFFAEENRYDFIKHLNVIFQTVEKAVIVLNVNFFSGFFLDSDEDEDDAPVPNPESATLWELKTIFENQCDFLIIATEEFSWDRIDQTTLNRLEAFYGKDNLSRFRHQSNPYVWSFTENPPEKILEKFRMSSLDNVRQFLNQLPSDTERDFETEITKYSSRNNNELTRANLSKILDGSQNPDKVSYGAFYALVLMHRQLKDFNKMKDLFNNYGNRFNSYKSYSHIWVLYLIECGDEFDFDEALRLSYEDCNTFPDNAGFIHLFADVYATICESLSLNERTHYINNWGEKANEMVDKAIKLSPDYAKYYCTKARILALNKDYNTAGKLINIAMDKESSSRDDYQIRLLYYQYHKTMIQMNKKADEILEILRPSPVIQP